MLTGSCCYAMCLQCIVLLHVLFVNHHYVVAAKGEQRLHRGRSSGGEQTGDTGTSSQRRHNSGNALDRPNGDDVDDDVIRDFSPEELFSLSTNNEELSTTSRKPIDPKSSWLTFTNRVEGKKSERKRKKRKRNKKTNSNILLGPPGPQGPQGPPGPPGKTISKEEILEAVKNLIEDAAELRAQEIIQDMALTDRGNNCCNSSNVYVPGSDIENQFLSVPRVHAGFSMKLNTKTRVRRKTLMELKSFQQPFGDGAFQRGPEIFNAREGRFHAPRDGIYQFTANLNMRMRTKRKMKGRSKHDEHLRLVLCIDSLCQSNTSIETVTAVSINNTIFSSQIQGLLHLKTKQYTSLYIDNSASYNILVLPGSQFFGVLLGV